MFRRPTRLASPHERPSGSAALARARLLGALSLDRTLGPRPAPAAPRPAPPEPDLLDRLLAQGLPSERCP